VFFGIQAVFHTLQFAATGAAIGLIVGRLPGGNGRMDLKSLYNSRNAPF
jgi:hypothetical protein